MITKVKNLLGLEDELLTEVRLQDFKDLYHLHSEHVRKVIFWMVRNDVVDDLVQETFLKAWNSFDRFNNDSSFKTWIHKIAVNTANDYFRKNKKVLDEFYEENVSDNLEIKQAIHMAIMKMNLKIREVFILYYQIGYTSKEIESLLSRPEGTIKYQLKEGRDIFKSFFKDEGLNYE